MSEQTIDHYLAVLIDLRAERRETNAMIARMEQRIRALGGNVPTEDAPVKTPVAAKTDAPPAVETVTPLYEVTATADPPRVGVKDTAYKVLRDHGKPLHVSRIMTAMQRLGEFPQTSARSLSNGLPKDGQNRFENLGRNVWALREWSEAVKRSYRTNAGV